MTYYDCEQVFREQTNGCYGNECDLSFEKDKKTKKTKTPITIGFDFRWKALGCQQCQSMICWRPILVVGPSPMILWTPYQKGTPWIHFDWNQWPINHQVCWISWAINHQVCWISWAEKISCMIFIAIGLKPINTNLVGGCISTHLKNMLVKLDHFPRDENKKKLETTTQ